MTAVAARPLFCGLPAWLSPRAALAVAFALSGAASSCATTPPPVSKIVGGRVVQSRAIHAKAYEHVARAHLFQEEERWEEAVAELSRALEFDQDAPELYAQMAELELALGRLERAKSAAAKSLQLGETPTGLIALAHVRQRAHDPTGAIAALRRATELTSFVDEGDLAQTAYLELADAQLESLDLPGARTTLEMLATEARDSSTARIRLASVLWSQGAMPEVERRLRETLAAEPNHVEALLTLAWAATAQDRQAEAHARFTEALERAEGALDVAAAFARFLIVAGRNEEAGDLVDDLATGGDDQTLLERIELCRSAQRNERGLALAQDRRVRPGIDGELAARLDRAMADLKADKAPSEAIALLLRVPKSTPSFTAARLRAAELAREHGRLPEARRWVTELESDAPSDGLRDEIVIALAAIDERENARQAALDRFASALLLRPKSVRLRLSHAALLERQGRVPEALREAAGILRDEPGNAEVLNFWGFLAAEHRLELPLAIRRIQAALAFDPGSGAIIDSLGWAYLQSGRLPEATLFLEQAARLEPDDPEILAHLGALFEHKGQADRALASVRKALARRPSAALKRKLEDQRLRLERPPTAVGGGNSSGAPAAASERDKGKP